MMFPEVHPAVVSGLGGATIAAVLALLAYSVKPDADGWRHIKPGLPHWVGVVLGAGLTCLFSYIYVFVGSARSDADYQMTILFWMTLIFGACTLYMSSSMFMIVRQRIHWRGEVLAFSTKGRVRQYTFADVTALKDKLSGDYVLHFVDGKRLVVDANAKGAMEFIDAVEIYFLDPTTP